MHLRIFFLLLLVSLGNALALQFPPSGFCCRKDSIHRNREKTKLQNMSRK